MASRNSPKYGFDGMISTMRNFSRVVQTLFVIASVICSATYSCASVHISFLCFPTLRCQKRKHTIKKRTSCAFRVYASTVVRTLSMRQSNTNINTLKIFEVSVPVKFISVVLTLKIPQPMRYLLVEKYSRRMSCNFLYPKA